MPKPDWLLPLILGAILGAAAMYSAISDEVTQALERRDKAEQQVRHYQGMAATCVGNRIRRK